MFLHDYLLACEIYGNDPHFKECVLMLGFLNSFFGLHFITIELYYTMYIYLCIYYK